MSYRISFTISCPQLLSEESPRLPAEILLAQGPDQAPAFSVPRGCPRFSGTPACIDCYRKIRTMFQNGQINFYNDPRSVHGVFYAAIPRPIRPK